MTQTIRTANGRNAVWIEANYISRARLAEYYKITLSDFLNQIDLENLDSEQAYRIKEELLKFKKGYAYQTFDGGKSEIFETEKEARQWCWSRDY